LKGKGVTPKIAIEENVINFGNVRVDSISIKSITIKNSGDGPLIITAFDV
jgi:hypothetical protein